MRSRLLISGLGITVRDMSRQMVRLILRVIRENAGRVFLLGLMILANGVSYGSDDSVMKVLSERDQQYRAAEERARTGTLISPLSISAPVGRFLLVRNGSNACALRFTDTHRGGDARPPSWWQEGGESEYAEYEW